MARFQGPRGVPDVLPPDSELLSEVEAAARTLFDRYGYRRIELPVFESTDVFERIGSGSDIIVQKEMYTFTDPRGRSLTLRPEGTAGAARAFVERGVAGTTPLPVRFWYIGPMFRYERPQKGRDRQFFQIGAECIGSASPMIDAELIALMTQFYEAIDLETELLLNSIGCVADRERYGPALRKALGEKTEDLCDNCQQRLATNPLRVFDCKVPSDRKIVRDAPPISEFLCDDCRTHLGEVQRVLESLGIAWKDAPDLVRGLDYYTRTVFEFVVPELGARPAVCGGGRYDGLVEQLGGSPTPAAGFSVGMTSTLDAVRSKRDPTPWRPDIYVCWLDGLGEIAMATALDLRRAARRVIVSDESKPLRVQLKTADRLGAATAVILGPDEVARGVATVRDMASGEQREVDLRGLVGELA